MLEDIAKLKVGIEANSKISQSQQMREQVYTLDGHTGLQYFPLTTIEEIEDFDKELETEDILQKYVST